MFYEPGKIIAFVYFHGYNTKVANYIFYPRELSNNFKRRSYRYYYNYIYSVIFKITN